MATRIRSEIPKTGLVSLAAAAEVLGVSVKTVRRRISDGSVRGYRVGSLIRVDIEELRSSLIIEIPAGKK